MEPVWGEGGLISLMIVIVSLKHTEQNITSHTFNIYDFYLKKDPNTSLFHDSILGLPVSDPHSALRPGWVFFTLWGQVPPLHSGLWNSCVMCPHGAPGRPFLIVSGDPVVQESQHFFQSKVATFSNVKLKGEDLITFDKRLCVLLSGWALGAFHHLETSEEWQRSTLRVTRSCHLLGEMGSVVRVCRLNCFTRIQLFVTLWTVSH